MLAGTSQGSAVVALLMPKVTHKSTQAMLVKTGMSVINEQYWNSPSFLVFFFFFNSVLYLLWENGDCLSGRKECVNAFTGELARVHMRTQRDALLRFEWIQQTEKEKKT